MSSHVSLFLFPWLFLKVRDGLQWILQKSTVTNYFRPGMKVSGSGIHASREYSGHFFFFFWYCNELIVRSFADKWRCITGKDVKQAAYKVLSTIVVFYIVTGLVVCSDTAPKYNSKNYRKSQNALSSENPVNKNQVVQWGVWSSAAFDGIAGFVLVNLNFSSS